MSGGVPPSSRAGKRLKYRSPNAEIRRAASLYERFSGHEANADESIRVKVKPLPKVGVLIGDIDFVGYTTVRDGVLEKYIHKFRPSDKPAFVVSPDGRSIHLIGGRYRFTERGIVDNSDRSR